MCLEKLTTTEPLIAEEDIVVYKFLNPILRYGIDYIPTLLPLGYRTPYRHVVIELNKNNTLIPYAGLKLAYLVRPGFTEKGLEALQIQGNNSWNVKPEVGVEFKTSTNEFKNGWKLKGTLDLSYGYELVDNNSERARLTAIEDDHHNLATSRDENGTLKTKAIIGAEIEDKYGIFLTGEYLTGNSNKNDYKAGLTLKAVF